MSITLVNDTELERELQFVRSVATSPIAGVFGPTSMMWRIARENLIFLGAGRALLLQLAHPWVARAISEHSRVISHPLDRFHQTFNVMFTMAAVGPFAQGSPYWASEVSALC